MLSNSWASTLLLGPRSNLARSWLKTSSCSGHTNARLVFDETPRGCHAWLGTPTSIATCCPTPCASQKQTPLLPHSLPLPLPWPRFALPHSLVAPERSRHGRRYQALWPPPLTHPSSPLHLSHAPCVFAVMCCSSPKTASSCRPRATVGALCLPRPLTRRWPGDLRPSRVVSWMLMDPLVLTLPFFVAAGPPPARFWPPHWCSCSMFELLI